MGTKKNAKKGKPTDEQSIISKSTRSTAKTAKSSKSIKKKAKGTAEAAVSNWRNFKHLQPSVKFTKPPALPTGKLVELLPRKSSGRHFYKRPVERLVRRLKEENIENLHEDLNIHRHRARRQSFIGGRGVKKEVELIQRILVKHGKKQQPKIGWEYNKRQKRLLMGYRHRKLETGWKYFEPIKDLFPRHMKPNKHTPDAIFFFFNMIIFMMTGIFEGVCHGAYFFTDILEDSVEWEIFINNQTVADAAGHNYWDAQAPFKYYTGLYVYNVSLMWVVIFFGFLGMYLADQRLHLVYVLGMLLSLSFEGLIAFKIQQKNFCVSVLGKMSGLMEQMVTEYYHTVEAVDVDGVPIYWTNPDTGQDEPVRVRTYKAANLLDRIQSSWHCCGIDGYQDYLTKNMEIPQSCCTRLWNLNPYCAKEIPIDVVEFELKINQVGNVGCKQRIETICTNAYRILGTSASHICYTQLAMFAFCCVAMIMQARQIRQLRRHPNLRISAGSISQSLQASERGGGAVKVLEDAAKLNEKHTDHLNRLRREAGLDKQDQYEESNRKSSSSETEKHIHTVNFSDMKNLQQYVDTEDRPQVETLDVDKVVEGFAGRFNIVANKALHNYVTGIFSTTFQNETNAAVEAINQTLERQFAQHTTDYDWRKLVKSQQKRRDPRTMTMGERRLAQQKSTQILPVPLPVTAKRVGNNGERQNKNLGGENRK